MATKISLPPKGKQYVTPEKAEAAVTALELPDTVRYLIVNHGGLHRPVFFLSPSDHHLLVPLASRGFYTIA